MDDFAPLDIAASAAGGERGGAQRAANKIREENAQRKPFLAINACWMRECTNRSHEMRFPVDVSSSMLSNFHEKLYYRTANIVSPHIKKKMQTIALRAIIIVTFARVVRLRIGDIMTIRHENDCDGPGAFRSRFITASMSSAD